MTDHPRRFTPPWSIAHDEACAVVFDVPTNGQALSYVYYENEPGRRTAAGLLTFSYRSGSGGSACILSDSAYLTVSLAGLTRSISAIS
jgi:hypothetical protein